MKGDRRDPIAVVLRNRNILVVGKSEACPEHAEYFDVSSGVWKLTGEMKMERALGIEIGASEFIYYGMAALLSDGRVLYVNNLRMQIYEPETNSWRQIPLQRNWHSFRAVMLPNDRVFFVIRAQNVFDGSGSCVIYNIRMNTWTDTTNMPASLSSPNPERRATGHLHKEALSMITMSNGHVLVIDSYYVNEGSAYKVFDPSSGRWTNYPDPAPVQSDCLLIPLPACVLVFNREGTFLFDPFGAVQTKRWLKMKNFDMDDSFTNLDHMLDRSALALF